MPVTVNIEKQTRRDAAVVPADLSDYAVSERSEGLKAFLLWMLLMVVFSGGPLLNANTFGFGIGIFAWWLLTVIGYFWLAPRLVLRRLRLHAPEYSITKKNHLRLKTMLSKGSALLGIAEPDGFAGVEGPPLLRILGSRPHFVVITQATIGLLEPPELDCLLLRAMIHARQGHVRRLMLQQFLGDTPPAARILVWPVVIYGFLLRAWWEDQAHQTADRLTLLMIRNPRILTSAILKMQAANDPAMQEKQITAEDVTNYIKQAGNISLQGTEISTQYKIGSAIHDNPYLEDRLQNITNWSRSPEFQAALQKLDEARADKK